MEPIENLGTEVFLYVPDDDPNTPDVVELTELIGPGFGNAKNKYVWSATLFDSDDDGTAELYVGTLNSEPDIDGAFGAEIFLKGLASSGQPTFYELLNNTDTEEGFAALRDFLSEDIFNVLNTDGGEIWQYDFEATSWTQVYSPELSNGYIDDGDLGFRDAVTYADKAFFSTSTSLIYNIANAGDNEAKIVWSADGTTWQPLEAAGGPLDVEGTRSIRALTELKDGAGDPAGLLVGTENLDGGAQIWLYREGDGDADGQGEWILLQTFEGDEYTSVISEIEQVNVDGTEKIYAGGWFPYTLFEIDVADVLAVEDQADADLLDFTPITPLENDGSDNFSEITDEGVMQIIAHEGYLYVGSVNYTFFSPGSFDFDLGASLYRSSDPSDPESWETVTTDGFATETGGGGGFFGDISTYVWQTVIIDDELYATELKLSFGGYEGGGARLFKIADENGNLEVVLVPEDANDPSSDPLLFGEPTAFGIRKAVPVSVAWDGEKWVPVAEDDPNAVSAAIFGYADSFQAPATANPFELLISDEGELVLGNIFTRDVLSGSDGEDLILGGMRRDVINAGAEDDLIISDAFGLGILGGNDRVNGGEGEDVVLATSGRDWINGDEGEDMLVGGAGPDIIRGGEGADLIIGDFVTDGPLGDIFESFLSDLEDFPTNGAPDAPQLPEGMDIGALIAELTGAATSVLNSFGRFNDILFGNEGNDAIIGGLGVDRIFGGDGIDVIYGLEGRDRIFGQDGDDVIYGGEDDDFVRGGAGDDSMITGPGDDRFVGGPGADRYVVRGGEDEMTLVESGDDLVVDFEVGEDVIDLSFIIDPVVFGGGPTFDIVEDIITPGAITSSVEGWLVVDLDLINGNADGADDGADATGSITLRGVDYTTDQPTIESLFKFDSTFDDSFSLISFG